MARPRTTLRRLSFLLLGCGIGMALLAVALFLHDIRTNTGKPDASITAILTEVFVLASLVVVPLCLVAGFVLLLVSLTLSDGVDTGGAARAAQETVARDFNKETERSE